MTVSADRLEDIARYERKVKDRIYKDQDEAKLKRILAYLRGEADAPVSLTQDDEYAFDDLELAFAPLDAWGELDQRVLKQMLALWTYTKPGKKRASERGYFEGFYGWLVKEVRSEAGKDRHAQARKHLLALGVEEQQILRHTVDEMSDAFLDEQGAPSSAGRFVLSHFPAAFEAMLGVVLDKRMEVNLATLLAQHRADELEPLIDDWLARTGEWGRFQLLRGLLGIDVERYEARAVAALDGFEESWPRFQVARALSTHVGAAHHARTRQEAEALLVEIREARNTKKSDYNDSAWDSASKAFISKTPTVIDWLLTTFGLDAREVVHGYIVETKQINLYTLGVIADKLGQDALETLAEALDVPIEDKDDADYLAKVFRILDNVDWSSYHDRAWELARHSSKPIRETVAAALGRQGAGAREGALALCAEKKADLRQTGAMILAGVGDAESLAALEALVQKEKNDDVRDFALEALEAAFARQRREIDQATIDARFAKAKSDKKLAKPVRPWLDEKKLPPLRWRDGKELGPEWTRYLLYRQSRPKEIASDIEARPLLKRIDREKSGPFAAAVLAAFIKAGENAKDRFCLGVAGLLGDDAVAQELRSQTIKWADSGRGKMGEYSVHALALLGSDRALRSVGDFARRYQNKQKNVGAAAEEAFGTAARELGIGPAELGDRLVPSFDFDEQRQRVFALDDKKAESTLTVQLGLDHKLTYTIAGKTTKSVPKAVPADIKAELKTLAKELTEVVRAQAARLEDQMVIQRRWPVKRWCTLFLQNAVLFPFAARQVWGAYDVEGERTATFQATVDGALGDADGEAIELADDAFAGLVHPLELDESEREHWRATLEARPDAPFFAQLDREMVTVDPAAATRKICGDYEDKELNAGTFRRRAEKLGWQRGSVCDGGGVTGYHKVFATAGIDVVLMVEGIGVSMDMYGKATLGKLMFVRDGSVHYGSYVYDEPRADSDARLVALGEVPPIVYSEALGNLATICAEENE